MSTGKKTVPEIRFSGFSEPWAQRKLGDLAEIVGGGTPDTNNSAYWDGDIDWYAPAEMEGQRYAKGSVRKITELGLQKSSAKILPAHRTVLFTSRAGIGKMAILQRSGATNQGFQSLVLKDGTDPYFIYSMGEKIKDMAEGVASGSTFLEISGKMLGNLEIMVPNLKEQGSIATFFRSIDDLIAIYQHKYEALVAVKKAMLEKMFPREGETVPQIRFAGFTDPWEQRKVSDLFETVESGNRLPKTMICKGNIPYVVASNENNGIVDYISENQNDFHGNRMKLFAENSITFSIDNPEAIFVQKVPFFTSNIMRVLHNDKYNYYHIVCFSELIKGLTSYYNWSFKFSGPVVMSSDVFVPVKANGNIDLAEIEKIGKTLSELDNLITLHQRKCEVLKNLKSALLNKMFVNTTE